MLDPNEKQYYRKKVTFKRQTYDSHRKKFFRIEDQVDKLYKEYETERQARYRLTDGLAEVYRQGDQLGSINQMGENVHQTMKSANKELHNQREMISSAQEKT